MIGEAAVEDRSQRMHEAASVGVLPGVEPEGLFVQIAEQVERGDRNVGALDRAAQKAPEVFEPVGVDLPLRVALGVVYHLVDIGFFQPVVGLERVGEDARARLDMLADTALEFMLPASLDDMGTDLRTVFAMPGQEAHDGGLPHPAGPLDDPLPLRLVHVAGLPADEGFVYLNLAVHLLEGIGLHREPDALEHVPRGLLSDADRAAQFVAGHAVLAVQQHPHGREPLGQRKGRILEDRAELDRELLPAVLALPDAAGLQEVMLVYHAATGANLLTIRPADVGDERQRNIFIREVADGFEQGFRRVLCVVSHSRVVGSSIIPSFTTQYTTMGLVSQVCCCPL